MDVLEIDNDFYITPQPNGFGLKTVSNDGIRVADLLNIPLNFYITDSNSHLLRLNERTAQSCGYISTANAIGRSIREVSKGNSAACIIENDRLVTKTRRTVIKDECFTRLDDLDLLAISIKQPLYFEKNLIGILGCSLLDTTPQGIAKSFSLLMQSGLLANPKMPGKQIDNVYYSELEIKILQLTIRGLTAKQIAQQVNLSPRTIEHRLEKIKVKAGVSTKAELVGKVFDTLY